MQHGRCGYHELAKLVAMPLQIIMKKYALLWLGSSNVTLHSCVGRRHCAMPLLRISWYTNNKRCFYCDPPTLPFFPLSPSVIRTVVGRVQVCMDWWSSSVRDQCYRRPRSNSKHWGQGLKEDPGYHTCYPTINKGKNISDTWLTRLSKKLGSSHLHFTIVQPSNALSFPNLDMVKL